MKYKKGIGYVGKLVEVNWYFLIFRVVIENVINVDKYASYNTEEEKDYIKSKRKNKCRKAKCGENVPT